jgi:bifunctional N-acetylglucosamine-1-phosphate-uridyltransferase/glucosamine-1-phosphate-acetyltransferase GlmU-like protein
MLDISGVILRVDNPNFKRSPSYELKIWGKSMLEWVSSIFDEEPIIYEDSKCNFEEDIVLVQGIINSHDFDCDYIAVLFSDTPLITRKTVLEACEFCENRSLNFVKMTRGFVIKNKNKNLIEEIHKAKRHYFTCEDDFLTANSFKTLSLINEVMHQRIIEKHMHNGVYFIDPNTAYIDDSVNIGVGVTVYPNNHLIGKTKIEDNVILYDGNYITDSLVGQNVTVKSSNINQSTIGNNTTVGPFAYLRPDSIIGEHCRIGDYVEVKKSRVGNNTKVSHLTYLGDCQLGENCNVGCGVVFCNYDGVKKHFTKVGNNVFIGSNSNIISPVVIEDNAFIAAGSTITENVIQDSLAIARARQVNKLDYKRKKLED